MPREVGQQVLEFLVAEFILDVEVNRHQHAFKRGIMFFDGFGRFVQFGADVVLEVFDV